MSWITHINTGCGKRGMDFTPEMLSHIDIFDNNDNDTQKSILSNH